MEESLSQNKSVDQPSVSAHGKILEEEYSFEVTARSLGLNEHFIYHFLFASAMR